MQKELKNGSWSKEALEKAVTYCDSIKPKNEQINVIEFGLYQGESIRMVESMFKNYQRPRFLLGVDSFRGLPEENEGLDLFVLFQKGMFSSHNDCSSFGEAKVINKWFSELNIEDVSKYKIKYFDIVHIDCDLYISTIQAYEFLLSNNLIGPNTIISYDEFKSTPDLDSGGESLAHKEICNKYKIEFEEFFRNQY